MSEPLFSETPEYQARVAALANWLQPGVLVSPTDAYNPRRVIRDYFRKCEMEFSYLGKYRVAEVRFGGSGRRDSERPATMATTQLAFRLEGLPRAWFSPVEVTNRTLTPLWEPVE